MSKDLAKSIGFRVASIRKGRGITQQKLAKMAGIHVTFLSGVEKGSRNITLETAEKIASALKVSLADLFSSNPSLVGTPHPTHVTFVKLGGTWDMRVTDEGLMGSGQLDDKAFAELEGRVRGERALATELERRFSETKPIGTTLGAHLPWVKDLDHLAAGPFYQIFSGDSSHYRSAVMAPALAYLLDTATRDPERQVLAGMGTDTVDLFLPYLDAFLFDRHDVYPILLSGANRSFREENSDAPQNFHDLAQATHLPLQPGAYYVFDRTIFKGGDITKVDPNENPTSLEGLTTFFAPQRTHARVGVLETGAIRRENHSGLTGPVLTYSAVDVFDTMNSVYTLNLGDMPDMDDAARAVANESTKGLVVVSHALGNVPDSARRIALDAARAGKLVINVSRALMGNTSERYYVALGSANERELKGTDTLILDGGRLSNRSAKALLVRALLEKRSQQSTKELVEAYKTRTF